ncbi:MAG: peroxiredoxin family protein [Desulfopila sp.]
MVNAGKEIPIIDMMPEKNADAKILSLVGKKAPEFSLPDLDDQVHRLSDMKGKNVVLVFWSIGCPHCKVELPMINDFYNEHTSSYNFEVIAVTQGCCPSGSQKTVDFVTDQKIDYPILLDPDGKVSGKYKFRYVPTAFFINRDGIIVDFSIGTPKYFKRFYHSVFTDPLRLGADDQASETGKEEQ